MSINKTVCDVLVDLIISCDAKIINSQMNEQEALKMYQRARVCFCQGQLTAYRDIARWALERLINQLEM